MNENEITMEKILDDLSLLISIFLSGDAGKHFDAMDEIFGDDPFTVSA